MQAIQLNGATYSYEVDVQRGRIFLEDLETKRKWQWLSDHSCSTHDRVEDDGRRVPDRVFLVAVEQCFCDGLTTKYGHAEVELEQRIDSLSLFLHVRLSLAITTDWRAKQTLELLPYPPDEMDLVRKRLAETRRQHQMRYDLNAIKAETPGAWIAIRMPEY